jgi:hypothetical protein
MTAIASTIMEGADLAMNRNAELATVPNLLKIPGSVRIRKGTPICIVRHATEATCYIPHREPNDNLQSIRLQGYAGVIYNCLVCHSSPPTGPGPHGMMYIGIKQISSEVPSQFNLRQNFPNPFNSSTVIRFEVSKKDFISVKVYITLARKFLQ